MRLYGKRSVIERINSNSRSVKVIYLQAGLSRPEITSLAHKHHLKVETISEKRFFQLAPKIQTQGVMAEIDAFNYKDFEDIIGSENKDKPTLVCLDRINDPQNLGVIIRNCACLGGFCIVLPTRETVEVTEAVLKVACGGENYVPVCHVSNLSIAVQKAKEQGYWVGATVVEGGEHPRQVKFNFPLCLIFGSEGEGIRPGLIKQVDYKLTLPMRGVPLSFNVAMAVGMCCYEVSCQRS